MVWMQRHPRFSQFQDLSQINNVIVDFGASQMPMNNGDSIIASLFSEILRTQRLFVLLHERKHILQYPKIISVLKQAHIFDPKLILPA